ncbi:hypothetical protein PYCC9005_003441 [Savitreella phatthalungensis]
MLEEIVIALVVIIVVAGLSFAGYLAYYHVTARRQGRIPDGMLPDHITNIFSRSSGGGGGGVGGVGGDAIGLRTGRVGRTKFSALDVDEAWDSHVDEEMGYESGKGAGGRPSQQPGTSKTTYYDELDDEAFDAPSSSSKSKLTSSQLDARYDDATTHHTSTSHAQENPFGSGAYRSDSRP